MSLASNSYNVVMYMYIYRHIYIYIYIDIYMYTYIDVERKHDDARASETKMYVRR